MRQSANYILMAMLAITFYGCHPGTTTPNGNWINRPQYGGNGRTGAVGFVIEDTAYVGTGYGTDSAGSIGRLNDFYKFYPDADDGQGAWSQIADFPGEGRNAAVGFAANDKGYVTTGYDGVNYLKDTWEYDPVTNSWSQKQDFGGSARYGAVAFGLNGKGYVTTGYDGSYRNDMWVYDPVADEWTQDNNTIGFKRMNAMAFVWNNKAYVVGGTNSSGLNDDFWDYDPTADSWTRLRDISNTSTQSYDDNYTSIERQLGAAFVIGDTAYIATGQSGGLTNTVWQYDPKTDLWVQRNVLDPGMPTRVAAVGFSVGGRGFVVTGGPSTGSLVNYDDTREFQPYVPDNTSDDN
jgi:N-acetylneuraminic acid mutarotase